VGGLGKTGSQLQPVGTLGGFAWGYLERGIGKGEELSGYVMLKLSGRSRYNRFEGIGKGDGRGFCYLTKPKILSNPEERIFLRKEIWN